MEGKPFKTITVEDYNKMLYNNSNSIELYRTIPKNKFDDTGVDKKYYRNWTKMLENKTFKWKVNSRSKGQFVQAIAIVYTPELTEYKYEKDSNNNIKVECKIGYPTDHYFESYFFPRNWLFYMFPRFFAKRILIKEFGDKFTSLLSFNPDIRFTTDILIPVLQD